MSCKLTAYSALAVIFLASPCWAMSAVTATTNSDGTPRFANPGDKPRDQFSGSNQNTNRGSSFPAFGGTVTLGSRPFGSNDPAASNFTPPVGTPDLARTAPTGSSLTDPTFGPNGVYTPGLHGDNPRQ